MLDLINQRFGRLVVTSYAGPDKRGKALWHCVCDCGTQKVILQSNLRSGSTVSCGCFTREQSSKRFKNGNANNIPRHGHSPRSGNSPTYRSWLSMNERCASEKHIAYKYYGGRGIKVCERWKGSFENFLEDMGERPEGKTIDRIDPNGNYELSNCKWATKREQALNRRRLTLPFTEDPIIFSDD